MCDFIKFEIAKEAQNEVLNRLGVCDRIECDADAEVKRIKWKKSGWTIKYIDEKYLHFSGNLGNYFPAYSTSQLTFSQIVHALNKLSKEFGFPLTGARVYNLEIPIDIEYQDSISELLSMLRYYRTTPFSQGRTSSNYKCQIECQLSQYRFKIYDWSFVHKNRPGSILRFENHYNKMIAAWPTSFDLDQIRNRDFMKSQYEKVQKNFAKSLLLEAMDRAKLDSAARKSYDDWSNIHFVERIMNCEKSVIRRREIKKLYSFQKKFGRDLFNQISNNLNIRSKYLISH